MRHRSALMGPVIHSFSSPCRVASFWVSSHPRTCDTRRMCLVWAVHRRKARQWRLLRDTYNSYNTHNGLQHYIITWYISIQIQYICFLNSATVFKQKAWNTHVTSHLKEKMFSSKCEGACQPNERVACLVQRLEHSVWLFAGACKQETDQRPLAETLHQWASYGRTWHSLLQYLCWHTWDTMWNQDSISIITYHATESFLKTKSKEKNDDKCQVASECAGVWPSGS